MQRARKRKFSIEKKFRIFRDRKMMTLKKLCQKYNITYSQFYKWHWEFIGKITEMSDIKRGAK